MRRRTTIMSTLALAATLALSGCSGDSSSPGSSGSGRTTIDITIRGGKVTPHGGRVKAEVGKPVTLHIDADKAGEIHVHSSPEQHIDFERGVSDERLTIDKPGIVDVEDHALDQVIVQLQVS
jgi:hypothetical protein